VDDLHDDSAKRHRQDQRRRLGRKGRALIYLEKTKKKTCPCARYARGLGGNQVSDSRANSRPHVLSANGWPQRPTTLRRVRPRVRGDRRKNGGGCTSQEIVDWARRHP